MLLGPFSMETEPQKGPFFSKVSELRSIRIQHPGLSDATAGLDPFS